MIKINLAPPSTGRGRPSLQLPALGLNLGVLFGVLYLVLLLGLGWYWWGLTSQRDRLTAEISSAERELATLKATIGQGANLRNTIAEMRARVEVIEALTRDQARPVALLDLFVDMVPRDLWITTLEEKNAVLRVSGTAFSTAAVADFMANLRRSGRFKDVDIIVSRQDLAKTPRVVTFEVTCRFEG